MEVVVREGMVVDLEVVVVVLVLRCHRRHVVDVVVEVLACAVHVGSFHGPVVRIFVVVSELQLWQFAKWCRCLQCCVVRELLWLLHRVQRDVLLERLESFVGVALVARR